MLPSARLERLQPRDGAYDYELRVEKEKGMNKGCGGVLNKLDLEPAFLYKLNTCRFKKDVGCLEKGI